MTGLISSAEIFPQDLAESQSFSEFPGQFDSFCSPSEDLLSLVREDSHGGQLGQTEGSLSGLRFLFLFPFTKE